MAVEEKRKKAFHPFSVSQDEPLVHPQRQHVDTPGGGVPWAPAGEVPPERHEPPLGGWACSTGMETTN